MGLHQNTGKVKYKSATRNNDKFFGYLLFSLACFSVHDGHNHSSGAFFLNKSASPKQKI